MPNNEEKEDVELLPVVEEKYNPDEQTNLRDFKDDGNFENAYLLELKNYSPKLSMVCEDQGYSDCFRDITTIVKELAEIKAKHLKNRYNKDYLAFYALQKIKIDERTWEIDAKNIDRYIYENIDIYERNLKECGYDKEIWFKKLPKDLYEHFNLNKTEIMKSVSNKI